MSKKDISPGMGDSDDGSYRTGQKTYTPGGGLSEEKNVDRNDYGYKKSKRDAQGYTGPTGTYFGPFTDNSGAETWKDSPVADDKLVRGGDWKNTLSGKHEQPRFTDYS